MSVTPTINMFTTADDYKVKEIWKNVKGDMPEKFKAVLLFYSEEHEDFEKAIDEWKDVTHSLNGGKRDGNFCICSHDIINNFYVENRRNKNKLRVGPDCIEKYFGEDVYEQCRNILKQHNYRNNGSGKYRMCASCHRHSIPIESEAWWTTCKSCYKKGEIQEAPLVLLEGRKCNMCNKITIKLEEPMWKKTCTFCYKNRKQESSSSSSTEEFKERMCIKCKKTDIDPLASKNHKMCLGCYLGDLDLERICVKCNEMPLKTSAPVHHKMCWKCYKSTLDV